jgi:hypothetical protein
MSSRDAKMREDQAVLPDGHRARFGGSTFNCGGDTQRATRMVARCL